MSTTATLDSLNQQRADLIRQAAISGKPIDPVAVAAIDDQMKQAREAANLEREVGAARASIEAAKRRTSDAEHLASLVKIVEAEAADADSMAGEIEADLEALRAKIVTWQSHCRDMQAASGTAHSFAQQTRQTASLRSAPRYLDLVVKLAHETDLYNRRVDAVGRTFYQPAR